MVVPRLVPDNPNTAPQPDLAMNDGVNGVLGGRWLNEHLVLLEAVRAIEFSHNADLRMTGYWSPPGLSA